MEGVNLISALILALPIAWLAWEMRRSRAKAAESTRHEATVDKASVVPMAARRRPRRL